MKRPVTKTRGLRLRPMTEADLASVLAVEQAAYAFPWSRQIFTDCLEAGYSCWVGELAATNPGALPGSGCGLDPSGMPDSGLTLPEARVSSLVTHGVMGMGVDECQIFNLCVHPQWQGQGIGRAMLRHLLQIARRRGAKTAFLEVRVSNARALALYRSEGFCEVGLRRGYYPASGGREDAWVMALELMQPATPSPPFP